MSYEDRTQKAHAPLKKTVEFYQQRCQNRPVKRNSNRDLVLEGAALARFFGGKLDNAAAGLAQN